MAFYLLMAPHTSTAPNKFCFNFLISFIIQAKEKLITSLQSGEGVAMGGVTEAKLEEMRLEKEHLSAQLESALQGGESLRAELQVCVRGCVMCVCSGCLKSGVCDCVGG